MRLGECWQAGLNLLYPPQCAACGEQWDDSLAQGGLCQACVATMVPADFHPCPRCAAPIPAATAALHARALSASEAGAAEMPGCLECQAQQWKFDRVWCLGPYQNRLRSAVLQVKQGRQQPLAWALAQELAERRHAEIAAWQPDVLAPIPPHWTRRLRRGASLPDDLAERLGRAWNVEVSTRLLTRSRRTPSQGDLGRAERYKNVRDSFRLVRRIDLACARVLLVDDVLTTGATCSAAAKVLRTGGAAAVAAVVIGRAKFFHP